MTQPSVTLRNIRDELGTRYLRAVLSVDGVLTIEGHDLGDGVEQIFGLANREYEWVWTIQSADVAQLLAALHGGDDILAALHLRFSNDRAAAIKPFLDQHGIKYEVWSRVGD
jgi:hypothetical protein